MKKFICTVCGYIYEGETAPEKCPLCKAPASKFKEMEEDNNGLTFVDEHVIGVAKGCDEEMIKDLNNHFMGECTEVGMYLAMSRQADREGYPEVAEAFKRYAWEEAEHASKFAELLGDCVWDTKTNLEKRMNAEAGACEDKKRIATSGKSGGEFFTPQEVSELLARIVIGDRTDVNKVYDPACGSGSLLLRFARILGQENVRRGFFGQEINITTYNLARINMFLHKIPFDKFDIALGDTLMDPKHWDDEPFDAIVSNPPYSIKWGRRLRSHADQ